MNRSSQTAASPATALATSAGESAAVRGGVHWRPGLGVVKLPTSVLIMATALGPSPLHLRRCRREN